jgi:flavin reductase (DIM6/NTAB) family NADH-FMN oxidoreductase RutF
VITTTPGRVATEETVWRVARRFPTGVSVVTVGTGDDVHGGTVSAFSFVSASPPLVSLCLRRTSRLLDVLRTATAFTVNVLASGQAGLARHFASRGRGHGPSQFERIGWSEGDGGVPLLHGTVSWLHCRPIRCIPAGDHELVLAEVVSLADCDDERALAPLLYFGGDLHAGHIPGSSPNTAKEADT